MQKFKLVELLNSREILNKLSQQQAPAVVAYRLAKIIKEVNEELTKFDEIKNTLFKQYGNVDNNTVTIKEESREEFSKELSKLLEEEVELNITKLNLELIVNLNLTAFEMLAIEKFIDE